MAHPRVTLVIPSLTSGGAERVMAWMASAWASQGWPVTLVTTESRTRDFYPLHPAVERISLEMPAPSARKTEVLRFVARGTVELRRAVRASRPDVVISFLEVMNVLVLMATRGLGVPVIVSERTDPREHRVSWIWNVMRRALYRSADAVVVQTRSVRGWAEEFLDPRRVYAIPNAAAPPPECAAGGFRDGGARTVAALGRLGPEKGFDLLLDAAARSLARHEGWSLMIVGDGPERAALEQRAEDLGIAARVRFTGRVRDPVRLLRTADLFVLSSRYEGFPNALLEAMACGLAVIGTDCRSGPGEIIRHGVDGLLVPAGDAAALAEAMDRLMGDAEARARLAARAPEVLERFGAERVMEQWESAVRAVCEGPAASAGSPSGAVWPERVRRGKGSAPSECGSTDGGSMAGKTER